MPQNRGFYAGPGGDTPSNVKYRPIGKFPRKLLVWIAISPKGVSKPTIRPSSTNVSAHVYITKCLSSKLKPFIEANYPRGGYVFWPDLASAHYARATCQFLEEAGIPDILSARKTRRTSRSWDQLRTSWAYLNKKSTVVAGQRHPISSCVPES